MTDPDIWAATRTGALDMLHVDGDGHPQAGACHRSCYECLRSFYNQWHHDVLDRNLAVPFFLSILQRIELATEPAGSDWSAGYSILVIRHDDLLGGINALKSRLNC
jgi:hypothetical protein